MSKALDAFRTISEVADELDVQKHVLRFWENKFPQVRPMKRGGGRRYYRPDDLDLLRGIRFLLHREGYTIKGVQKLLREHGVDFVKACWQPGVAASAPAQPAATKVAAKPSKKLKLATTGPTAAAAAKIVPAALANDRKEFVARLKTLAAELEACRQILLGNATGSNPEAGAQLSTTR